RGYELAWRRVTVRPVLIQEEHHLQVSHLDERQDTTKNYRGAEASAKVDDLLDLPFSQIHVVTTETEIQVQISRKGVARVHKRQVAGAVAAPSLAHDREKPRLIPGDVPDEVLQALEIQAPDGRIRAGKRRKFLQINEFLRLMMETAALEALAPPVHIVDCGCGSADLTFAVYHYLNHILGLPATAVGIDVKEDLIAKQNALAQKLGWHDVRFEVSRIIDFEPVTPPDMVLALHACDTATDEALAQAVRWDAPLIFSAPCCHHHLQAQMAEQPMPPLFQPVLRHGILKERVGDVLTDSFRAQILRILGYSTDVIEFISPEHTDKNLMIRAVKQTAPGDPQVIGEYRSLIDFWGVEPYLASLLREQMAAAGAGR
ncbi:MAG: SAM-dependent methyltransferase, partial [Anaerolineae bacterium]|nr:SAM-dependent methyltransferase [Anaerolineae bacterium]